MGTLVAMPSTRYDQAIADMRGLVEHRSRVEASIKRRFVETLAWHRSHGVPWTVLADGLGIAKQTAHRAWSTAVADRLRAGEPARPTEPDVELW
ncbi:hypothetical protein [Nocardioides sambongensis]|uniref:hypothetical protein n=1 Tax=Nocardioides sambongensis TaxID=2589074 RepID=UPI001126E9A6|nr:hypothetical protein [Nocardioides sambongensis]